MSGRIEFVALSDISNLAVYRNGMERIQRTWPAFLEKRNERLQQQVRHGTAAEKVTENIIEDLLTGVLDWSLGDLNNQLHHSDIVLTGLGIGRLVVETKRPGSLTWNQRGMDIALEQARRYAAEQRVRIVAVSDGTMFYAADVEHGGLRDRVFCNLEVAQPALELWWLSMHGIYRVRPDTSAGLRLLPEEEAEPLTVMGNPTTDVLLHPKYHLPARCFAYVGDASKTSTWKLPFLSDDGNIDPKRLPKAIGSILTNYRGSRVRGIPEKDIQSVLERLAWAAQSLGHMPPTAANPAQVYRELAEALAQLSIRNQLRAQD